jgi:non-ribosomal peptide synthetase component F
MVLHTVLAILVARYSNETDIVIGTPIAGRTHADTESLIGFFLNTLVLRTDLQDRTAFADVLADNKQTILDAYTHQHVPFEMLVERLQPERSLSHSPVFQITFTVQNNEATGLDLPDLNVSGVGSEGFGVTKFDLQLSVAEVNGTFVLDWSYNRDLFEKTTIQRLSANFEVLLRGIVGQPECQVGQLPVLTAEERRRVVQEWNDTGHEFPDNCCIHAFFEQQVARTPEAVAMVFADRQLSYAELNERANRLAHYLIGQGIKPDTPVALCLERSPEMMVAILATVKAGGAYMPLDPAFPEARLAAILADSEPPVILTQKHLTGSLPDAAGAEVVCLDNEDWLASLADYPTDNPDAQKLGLNARHLAYVIYTSGSTGKPKGVCNEHRALVNRLDWMQRCYVLQPHDRVLQKTPYTFDVSVWEFFWPMMTGAALVFARPEGHRDPDYLIDIINRHSVTTLP